MENKYIKEFKEAVKKLDEKTSLTEKPTATKQFVDMEYGLDYPTEEYEYEIDQNLVKKLNSILEELDLIAKSPYGNHVGPNYTRIENDFNHDAGVAAGICHDTISELFEKYKIEVSDKVKGMSRYGLTNTIFNDDHWLQTHPEEMNNK